MTRNSRKPSNRILIKQRELAKLKRNQRILNTIPIRNKNIGKKNKRKNVKNSSNKRRAAFKHAKKQILNLCF